MIGLTKDFFRKETDFKLNPVMYRYSMFVKNMGVDFLKTQVEMIEHSFMDELQHYLDDNNYREFIHKYGFNKLYEKDDNLRRNIELTVSKQSSLYYYFAFSKLHSTEKKGKKINNYDECEWRYVYPFIYKNLNNNEDMWKLNINISKFEEDKNELNKQLWEKDDCRIIPNKDICKSISFIVVRTDKQIEKMIKFIRNAKTIFGNRITQEEKDIIISKITSFESIETNY